MRPARLAILAGSIVAMVVAVVVSAQQTKPAKPMQIEKVKDGLYVIRGPFNPCAPNGCGGGYRDDGLLHEAGLQKGDVLLVSGAPTAAGEVYSQLCSAASGAASPQVVILRAPAYDTTASLVPQSH